MNYTPEQIIELAKEVELNDKIDWGDLKVDPDKIYQIIGTQVYSKYHENLQTADGEAILLATVVKLVVENFALTLKLEGLQ